MPWIAALAGLAGAGISASAQRSAANKAADAQRAELDKLGGLAGQYMPYQELGQKSAYSLGELMGLQGYRTAEEQALTDFMKTRPTVGAIAGAKKSASAKLAKYSPSANLLADTPLEKLGGFGAVSIGKDKRKRRRTEAAQAAEAQRKYESDLAAWEGKKAEMEKASQASLVNYNPTAVLRKTPGFQFRYKTGEETTNNLLNKLGMSQSGRALQELTNYGQEFASGEFNNEFNRRLALTNPGLAASGAATNLQSRGILGQSDIYGNLGAANSAYYGDLNNILQGSLANYQTYKNTQPNMRSSSYGGNTYSSPSLANYFQSQDDFMNT